MLQKNDANPRLNEEIQLSEQLALSDSSVRQRPVNSSNKYTKHNVTTDNSQLYKPLFLKPVLKLNKFHCTPVNNPNDPVKDFNLIPHGNTQLSHNSKNSHSLNYETLRFQRGFKQLPGQLLKINISGTLFVIKLDTLKRDQLVYEKFIQEVEWLSDTNEYYLERDPSVFRYVLNYLRYNELHLPHNMCGPMLEKELELWGLQLGFDMQRCCLGPVVDSMSKVDSLKKFEHEFSEPITKTPKFCTNAKWQTIREEVWRVIGDTPKKQWLTSSESKLVGDDKYKGKHEDTIKLRPRFDNSLTIKSCAEENGATFCQVNYMDSFDNTNDTLNHPKSLTQNEADGINQTYLKKVDHNWRHLSKKPKRVIFNRFYIAIQAINICSLILLVILTYVPELRVPFGPRLNLSQTNGTLVIPHHNFFVYRMYFAFSKEENRLTHPVMPIIVSNWICVFLFTLDLIMRSIFCPSFLRWLTSIYTITDVVSLIPFYVEGTMYFVIARYPDDEVHSEKMLSMLGVLDIVGLLKIFVSVRLFRMLQRQRATRVLLYTIRTTASNVFMLLELLALATVFFGTAVFFLDNQFKSVFSGMWWALITMATVGYGDIVPSSLAGYILAVFCVIVGLLLTSYIVPILVNDFLLYYGHSDQLAWMRRVHKTAKAKRSNVKQYLLTKKRSRRTFSAKF